MYKLMRFGLYASDNNNQRIQLQYILLVDFNSLSAVVACEQVVPTLPLLIAKSNHTFTYVISCFYFIFSFQITFSFSCFIYQ